MRFSALLPMLLIFATAFCSSPLDDYLLESEMPEVGFSPADVEATLERLPLTPFEGLWQMTGEGGIFAIVKDDRHGWFRIVAVDMPERDIVPGTLIGLAVPTAADNVLDATMKTPGKSLKLKQTAPFTIRLSGNDRLVINPAGTKVKVNILGLLPYMYRHVISTRKQRPENLDGAMRLYPRPESLIDKPRYL